MRSRMWFVVSTIAVLVAMPMAAQQPGGQPGGQRGGAPAAPAMTLTVSGFPDGGDVPVKFSQAAPGVATGEGLSPAISWANVPAGTQSFFLNMRDMDVARNKTTDDQAHWVVWNIPATATGLPEGVPKGPRRSAPSRIPPGTGEAVFESSSGSRCVGPSVTTMPLVRGWLEANGWR